MVVCILVLAMYLKCEYKYITISIIACGIKKVEQLKNGNYLK